MRLKFRRRERAAEVLIGVRSIRAAQEKLEQLRRASFDSDALTTTDWFLSRIIIGGDLPVVVLLHRFSKPYAAALFRSRRVLGIPTGVIRAGNLAGDGAVIASEHERAEALETAANVLLDHFLAHTVALSYRSPAPGISMATAGVLSFCWHTREARVRLSLLGGMGAFMQRHTRKFRRNFRYYRRRAEDCGCVFLPELTPEQSRDAVEAIQPYVRFPVKSSYATRLEALLRNTTGGFSMGLQDATGGWLGYLAGWRQSDATYVEWQLNRVDQAVESLSTVMRAYLIEHEARNGVSDVVFIGGASELWSRVCEEGWCADLVLTRKGIVGLIARELVCKLRPNGRLASLHQKTPISQALQERTLPKKASAKPAEWAVSLAAPRPPSGPLVICKPDGSNP